MSEAIILPGRGSNKAKKVHALGGFLWAIILVLFFLALIELAFGFLIAPKLIIKHLEVESDFPLSENEVLTIAGIKRKEYYFSINCEEIRKRLLTFPVVKEARVMKVFPETLRISLSRRIPLALAFGTVDQKTVPVAFDEEGVIFQIGKTIKDWNLPVISGLKFKPLMGLRLPKKLYCLLKDLYQLKKKAPELFDLISEIKVVAANSIDYELIFFPVGYSIRINLGSRINASLLKYSFMVLDVLKQQGIMGGVREIDFRTGEVVYKVSAEEG